MNTSGTIIDGAYTVVEILNTEGGMGTLLRVKHPSSSVDLALKYCLSDEDEALERFRREVRLMSEFAGNSKIVQILSSNLSHDPPYFVMSLCVNGDLRSLRPQIETDAQLQESTLLGMSSCVEELHRTGKFHRDIKPANFLREQHGIVISDFGLGMDLMSRTGITLSQQWGGTHGYVPPEFFQTGGFKNATACSDIFMLGKAFYNLLTGLDPQFTDKTKLAKPVFYLIERCCKQDPQDRYQSIPELKQAIVATYDMLLGRLNPLGEAQSVYKTICTFLSQRQYKAEDFQKFIALAQGLSPAELFSIIQDASEEFYFVLSQQQLQSELGIYLQLYEKAFLAEPFLGFSYAEHVADRMEVVFNNSDNPDLRAEALNIAIMMASRMNRFAAMTTCTSMLSNIADGDPAEAAICAMLQRNNAGFLQVFEQTSCKSSMIANQIAKLGNS